MKDYTTRVELMAVPIVVLIGGIGLILALASSAGVWAWLLVGVAGLALTVLVFALYSRRHPHPAANQPAPQVAPPADTDAGYRVLVIADESCVGPHLAEQLARHAEGRTVEALVIAPAIGSRLARWTGDEATHADARKHLDDTVAALVQAGISARGETGADDPLQAADDGLRRFPADEIVFVTKPGTNTDWVERGVIDSARRRYSVPVEHVTLTPG